MEFFRSKKEYLKGTLDEADLDSNPFTQAKLWLQDAEKANAADPFAMTLATASKDGKPSARTVLLKGCDGEGFFFFTHYFSRKARELETQPFATLVFLWKELERQLIIEGSCAKIDPSLSDRYFSERSRPSQVSAWASRQDDPIPSRDALEERYQICELDYRNKPIPRPPSWGGYKLVPSRFEFWQGREMRLHDRFQYTFDHGSWKVSRLCP